MFTSKKPVKEMSEYLLQRFHVDQEIEGIFPLSSGKFLLWAFVNKFIRKEKKAWILDVFKKEIYPASEDVVLPNSEYKNTNVRGSFNLKQNQFVKVTNVRFYYKNWFIECFRNKDYSVIELLDLNGKRKAAPKKTKKTIFSVIKLSDSTFLTSEASYYHDYLRLWEIRNDKIIKLHTQKFDEAHFNFLKRKIALLPDGETVISMIEDITRFVTFNIRTKQVLFHTINDKIFDMAVSEDGLVAFITENNIITFPFEVLIPDYLSKLHAVLFEFYKVSSSEIGFENIILSYLCSHPIALNFLQNKQVPIGDVNWDSMPSYGLIESFGSERMPESSALTKRNETVMYSNESKSASPRVSEQSLFSHDKHERKSPSEVSSKFVSRMS